MTSPRSLSQQDRQSQRAGELALCVFTQLLCNAGPAALHIEASIKKGVLSVRIETGAAFVFVFGAWFPIHLNPFHINGTSKCIGCLVLKDMMN